MFRTASAVCFLAIAAVSPLAAAPATTAPANKPPMVKEVVVQDCQKSGGEVSAMIDTSTRSPNLPAAKALFQRGIMECMEGDDETANKHYQDAKDLLGAPSKVAPGPAR